MAAFLAERFGDDLAALELWNEPNLDDGRSWRSEAPAGDYAQLVRAAVPAVRAAGVPVLAGSVAFADEPFLEALRDAGAFEDVDGVGLHPCTGDAPAAGVARPAPSPAATSGSRRRARRRAGPGRAGRAPGAPYVEELFGLDLPGVRALLVYQLRDEDTGGVGGGFGLVRRDFAAKPALAVARAGWR